MRKLVALACFGMALAAGAANAQVYVRIGPTAPGWCRPGHTQFGCAAGGCMNHTDIIGAKATGAKNP